MTVSYDDLFDLMIYSKLNEYQIIWVIISFGIFIEDLLCSMYIVCRMKARINLYVYSSMLVIVFDVKSIFDFDDKSFVSKIS